MGVVFCHERYTPDGRRRLVVVEWWGSATLIAPAAAGGGRPEIVWAGGPSRRARRPVRRWT